VALREARDEGMERGGRSRQIQAQPMPDAREMTERGRGVRPTLVPHQLLRWGNGRMVLLWWSVCVVVMVGAIERGQRQPVDSQRTPSW
jgi:hypothetical protein